MVVEQNGLKFQPQRNTFMYYTNMHSEYVSLSVFKVRLGSFGAFPIFDDLVIVSTLLLTFMDLCIVKFILYWYSFI